MSNMPPVDPSLILPVSTVEHCVCLEIQKTAFTIAAVATALGTAVGLYMSLRK